MWYWNWNGATHPNSQPPTGYLTHQKPTVRVYNPTSNQLNTVTKLAIQPSHEGTNTNISSCRLTNHPASSWRQTDNQMNNMQKRSTSLGQTCTNTIYVFSSTSRTRQALNLPVGVTAGPCSTEAGPATNTSKNFLQAPPFHPSTLYCAFVFTSRVVQESGQVRAGDAALCLERSSCSVLAVFRCQLVVAPCAVKG